MTRNLPSGERDIEPGNGLTLMDLAMARSEVFITSIRLAVKLAMYSTPLGSSSTRSEALPPMGTTLPNVPAQAFAVSTAARRPQRAPERIPADRMLQDNRV